MDELQFSVALQDIWQLIGECNRYIDQNMPWVLAKTEEGKERLKTVMYVLCESIRIVGILIAPTMPRTPARIFEQLGVSDPALCAFETASHFGTLPAGGKVRKGERSSRASTSRRNWLTSCPRLPSRPSRKSSLRPSPRRRRTTA